MDYKEKYEQAINFIKDLYPHTSDYVKEKLDDFFPELKESEDERIRKALISVLKGKFEKDTTINGIRVGDIITWVEKQAEVESDNDDIEAEEEGIRKAFNKIRDKKQGEQKPSGKVEPKFHEGDWIVFNGLTLYINEVVQGYYRTISIGGIPNSYDWDIDNIARLWTLQDAKAGDVLVCKGNIKYSNGIKYERICLFNNVDKAFFTLTKTSNFVEEYGIDVNIDYPDNTVPATKEQKEILFMVMKEAGYEWNAEKKELKKVEDEEYNGEDYGIDSLFHAQRILEKTLGRVEGYQTDDGILSHKCAITAVKKLYEQRSAEWSKEDEEMCQETIDWFEKKCFPYALESENPARESIKWLKSLKDRVQPKQEWSEEDENRMKKVMHILSLDGRINNAELVNIYDWLKSLRPQNNWKPSEEQMDALNSARWNAPFKIEILDSLYNDLKKLKE